MKSESLEDQEGSTHFLGIRGKFVQLMSVKNTSLILFFCIFHFIKYTLSEYAVASMGICSRLDFADFVFLLH